LSRVEIFLFVLRVSEEKVDLFVGHQVVDNPDTAALAAPAERTADFAQAAASADNVARSRFKRQGDLQLAIVGIIQQRGDLPRENLRFDKMHTAQTTPMA
jgi:hypothetical protein